MKLWKSISGLLILVTTLVWLAVFAFPDNNLHLIACDVGEGDAILAVYKNIQILTDGGPDNKVLDCLGKYLPFWDRKVELIILTHPDKDHYQGLIEVFRKYQVDNFLSNGQKISSSGMEVLEKEVGSRGVKTLVGRQGTDLRVGKIQLDILNPTEEPKSEETNEFSIVTRLKYGDFEALLTGDAPKTILNQIFPMESVDYIKISHHGSKTGTDEELVARTKPKLAVISVGKNFYGHPDEGILKILSEKNIRILRTDLVGNIEVVSDGKNFWINR